MHFVTDQHEGLVAGFGQLVKNGLKLYKLVQNDNFLDLQNLVKTEVVPLGVPVA